MTNLVPPLNQPTIELGNNSSALSGSISNPPSDFATINIGQQITVHINPQSLIQQGNKLLLTMDWSLPDVNGNSQISSTQAELPSQLKLPSQPLEMQVRVISHTPQKIDFRIINIDGKPASSFVSSPMELSSSAQLLTSPSIDANQPTVTVQKHPLLPLKVLPLVEQSLNNLELPQAQISHLAQSLSNLQLKAEIIQIIPQNQTANMLMNPTPSLPLDIVQQLTTILKPILPSISQGNQSSTPIPSALPNLPEPILEQTQQALQQIVGREFPAQVINKGELKILQTPLGDIVPELPLKLEVGEHLTLKISELISTKPTLEKTDTSPLVQKVFDIIKPLQDNIKLEVYTNLVAKIPANNAKMLSNITSFIKAASNEDISAWLGQDIVDSLRSSGLKGQEALSQLEDLIIGRKEENSQWRIIEVPFYGAENLSKIRVAVRKYTNKDKEQHSRSAQPDAARFVIDTSFTALGAFQFDGFSIAKNRRFDLIIRTERDVNEDFCAHIMQLFRSSLSAVDYAGNIRINIKEKFIKLCEDSNDTTILQDGLYI